MSKTILENYQNISELVMQANYYISSTEGKKLQKYQRELLVDHVTRLLANFQHAGFSRADIASLVCELITRHQNDDHGWFIDIDSSNANSVVFVHPQRTKPEKRLVMPKGHALLAYNLIA